MLGFAGLDPGCRAGGLSWQLVRRLYPSGGILWRYLALRH